MQTHMRSHAYIFVFHNNHLNSCDYINVTTCLQHPYARLGRLVFIISKSKHRLHIACVFADIDQRINAASHNVDVCESTCYMGNAAPLKI